MKIAIIGSRDLTDEEWLYDRFKDIQTLETNESITMLVGGATGVQEFAMGYATDNHIDYVLFKPWHLIDPRMSFVPRFFFMRNKQIIDNAHKVYVLRNDKDDSEVDRAISYAEKRGKDLVVINYGESEEEV